MSKYIAIAAAQIMKNGKPMEFKQSYGVDDPNDACEILKATTEAAIKVGDEIVAITVLVGKNNAKGEEK